MNNENRDQKIAIVKMIAQKQINKKNGPVVRKKVFIKEPAVLSPVSSSSSAKQIIQPKLSDDKKSTEL